MTKLLAGVVVADVALSVVVVVVVEGIVVVGEEFVVEVVVRAKVDVETQCFE